MTTVETITMQLVDRHMQNLSTRFWHPQWEGPNLSTPDQVIAMQAAHGQKIDPAWEVWVGRPTRNSRNLDDTSERGMIRAAIGFKTVDQLLETPVEELALRLAYAIAGQAAHEALEWLRLDGVLVVDPHGNARVLGEPIQGIADYIKTAGR